MPPVESRMPYSPWGEELFEPRQDPIADQGWREAWGVSFTCMASLRTSGATLERLRYDLHPFLWIWPCWP
jgi:hypothetical protein